MSIINVDKIGPVGGGNTITISAGIASYTGKINCPEFDNNPSFTGNVTIAGNLGVAGTITYEDVARVDATGISTFREGFKVGPLTGIAATVYKDGSIRTSGIVTAVSFEGDGSSLTGINTAFGSGTSVNTTGIITATGFVPTQGQLSHRNLIINGAMNVAQRATTSTAQYYQTLDRWSIGQAGMDEAPTQAQVSLTSSDTGPWAKGFRNALQVTNGNQTSGAGAGDILQILYKIEAQDIANSGWDYTSASSYLTYSFWIKSSIAQTFNGKFVTVDGTGQNYHFQTGSLSANTWTKITKTFPGNSNITVNDDNGEGFRIYLYPFAGTDNTESITLNQWSTNTTCGPDMTSTWYTTNDSTFAITGVQLEVGSVATPFEHRSAGDELARCKRYYEQFNSEGLSEAPFGVGYFEANNQLRAVVPLYEKRADVSFSSTAASTFASMNTLNMPAGSSIALYKTGKKAAIIVLTLSSDVTSGDGRAGILCAQSSTEATLKFDSEL